MYGGKKSEKFKIFSFYKPKTVLKNKLFLNGRFAEKIF